VFFTHTREVLTYHYERNSSDPRIQHALTLEVDDQGNVLKPGRTVAYATTAPNPCVYGDLNAPRTMALFGDSHAAMWFPALERIAAERDWRIYPLVKFSCPPVSVTASGTPPASVIR